MFPAAREGDPVTHDQIIPAGSIGPPLPPCPPTMGPVMIEGLPAAHVGCSTFCTGVTTFMAVHPPPLPPTPPPPIAIGSPTVFIHGQPAARWTPSFDATACGAFLGDTKLAAARTVLIGNVGVPKVITFAPELTAAFARQWNDSFPDGKAQEHGGMIVTEAGALKMVNAGAGLEPRSASYVEDRKVAPGQTIEGVFHTHPFDRSEGSYTNISFSGADAAMMVNAGEDVSVVQSGEGLFVFKRTFQTPPGADHDRIEEENNVLIAQLTRSGRTFREASSQAARETARKLHLEYYEGKNGTVTQLE
jgi:uncharacterized Zn-binding protein involved in type VI secretion